MPAGLRKAREVAEGDGRAGAGDERPESGRPKPAEPYHEVDRAHQKCKAAWKRRSAMLPSMDQRPMVTKETHTKEAKSRREWTKQRRKSSAEYHEDAAALKEKRMRLVDHQAPAAALVVDQKSSEESRNVCFREYNSIETPRPSPPITQSSFGTVMLRKTTHPPTSPQRLHDIHTQEGTYSSSRPCVHSYHRGWTSAEPGTSLVCGLCCPEPRVRSEPQESSGRHAGWHMRTEGTPGRDGKPIPHLRRPDSGGGGSPRADCLTIYGPGP
jgi:hypothetical protein